jgi:ferredoxin
MGIGLQRLGPSWKASPLRRSIQTLCFVTWLILFVYVCWPYGVKDCAQAFAAKERIDAETFLLLDPLVSLSAAIAARLWVGSLSVAALVLGVCLFIPRGFCAYLCPLGTLLDLFDWAIGRRLAAVSGNVHNEWTHSRYWLLVMVLLAALFGVTLSGWVAAIPIFTRTMVTLLNPAQTGILKGWYLVPEFNLGHTLSIGLFLLILAASLLERRFWCTYLCPTGALFSLASLLRLYERKVETTCVKCGKCQDRCDFGAIQSNYSTHQLNCSSCRSCQGVCPAKAIRFAGRWSDHHAIAPIPALIPSRRHVLTGLGSVAALGAGVPRIIGKSTPYEPVVRAPGSVPEATFLQLCVRCGQCIKVCPNNVLQPLGFEHGLNGLWTPEVVADWSGCEPSCNNCGQVCPTGAIRALDIAEKRAARMALAVVDTHTCLPYAGTGPCQFCVDECKTAGYDAIEFIRAGSVLDQNGEVVPDSGLLAPVVRADKCVGCGLCQMRCRSMNVKDTHLLTESAIRIVAGPGKEDRLFSGSYIRRHQAAQDNESQPDGADEYLPDFLK